MVINNISADHSRFDTFSEDIGKRIRQARLEAKLNQTQLAEKLNKKQATISEIERGMIDINASTLLKLAIVLEKPVSFFFPQCIHAIVQPEKISASEAELITFSRKLNRDDLKRIVIQIRALAELAEEEAMEEYATEIRNIDTSSI